MAFISFLVVVVSLGLASTAPTSTSSCPKVKVYVAYDGGALIISENGGQTWSRRDPGSGNIVSIWATDTSVFLGADTLTVSNNGGHTWTTQYFRKDDYKIIASISGVGNRILLAGYANLIISEDLGKSWMVQPTPTPVTTTYLRGVYATDKRIFAGLGESSIWGPNGLGISDDGGFTWKVLLKDTPFESSPIYGIAGSGDDVYVQLMPKDFSAIAISNDGGESWGIQEITTVPASGQLQNNIVVDGQTVLVGTSVGLAMSDDVWDDWDLKTTGDGLASNSTLVAAVGDSIFAGTNKGLSISNDRGATWTTSVTPMGEHEVTAIFAHCLD